MLFLRALAALLVLPGTFAGLFPALIVGNDRWRGAGSPVGWIPLGLGIAIAGKGTLAPWDRPSI